jgi:glutamate-1-semialdehyde aminotransferase
MIFDQILTGFRLGLRGAQEYFGVIPDLTTYGKAIANGFPLAVFGGRREVMALLDQVMITTTHAGETLSLAAALATLDVMESEPVFEHIWAMGDRMQRGFNDLAARGRAYARCIGLPPALQFRFDADPEADKRARSRFHRTLLEAGIFPSGLFLLNYAHQAEHIDETLRAIRSGFTF